MQEWRDDELFERFTRACALPRARRASDFDDVARMLAEASRTRRGRRGAHCTSTRQQRAARPARRAARPRSRPAARSRTMATTTSCSSRATTPVGTLNEDFAIESMPGDIFQLGNTSWRILQVEAGKVRVEDAQGQPPTMPFWLGEAPGAQRRAVARRCRGCTRARRRAARSGGTARHAATGSDSEVGLDDAAAEQLVEYLGARARRRSARCLPSSDDRARALLRRDRRHAARRARALRQPASTAPGAWRCASASAGSSTSSCRRPRPRTRSCSRSARCTASRSTTCSTSSFASVRDVLVQALLDAPMFGDALALERERALAMLRFRGGKSVPPQLQRMRGRGPAGDGVPRPARVPRELPAATARSRIIRSSPRQSQDCLTRRMDIEGLDRAARAHRARRGRRPLPRAHEPVAASARDLGAKPYAFLDDAPARRTPHARRASAPLHERRAGGGARQARPRCDRARARRSLAGRGQSRRASRCARDARFRHRRGGRRRAAARGERALRLSSETAAPPRSRLPRASFGSVQSGSRSCAWCCRMA